MSGLATYNNYSSDASDSVKKAVLNEYKTAKSKKRMHEIKADKSRKRRERTEEEMEKEEQIMSKYRDRAKEVRELGFDKDFEGLRPEDFENLDEEDMKLLGGDASHTHLVKGLDLELLKKRREEIAEEEAKNRQMEEKQMELLTRNKHYGTSLGKQVYEIISNTKKSLDLKELTAQREFFMKGRNTYRIEFSENVNEVVNTIPSIIVHSKSDCNEEKETMYSMSTELLQMVSKSFQNGRSVSKLKKHKEKHIVKAVDDDVDIFSD